MRTTMLWLKRSIIKLSWFFAHPEKQREQALFGLGQFVLLLTLTPFIFDLSLYHLSDSEASASHYQYDPNRFATLPALQSEETTPSAPAAPKLKTLSKKKAKHLNQCKRPLKRLIWPNYCPSLEAESRRYASSNKSALIKYQKKLKAYRAFAEDQKKYQQALNQQYLAFSLNTVKPETTDIAILATAKRSLGAMLSDSISHNNWDVITSFFWLLAAILIIPAILICIKRQLWGLLAFGLLVPSLLYARALLPMLVDWPLLSEISTYAKHFAQVAFIWFIFKGKIRSKAFIYFIGLLVLSILFAKFTNGKAFNSLQALLPIVVFIISCLMARFIVKMVQENAYLFRKLGWGNSIKTGLHALILWLPIALIAVPYFVIVEIVMPKHAINSLHNKAILSFNHEHDLLDNTLQSTALQFDHAIYAWHLSTENLKKEVYLKGKRLTDADLKKEVQQTFDRIIPEALVFDAYDSDAFIVAPIVEMSVDASQASTNQAFKKMRQQLRTKLGALVSQYNREFTEAIAQGKDKAWTLVDDIHQEGQALILSFNQQSQTAFWWSINYMRAAHQLTILLFIFICIKSYLYVFSRVSFNRNTASFVTLGETSGTFKPTPSHIQAMGPQYVMQGGEHHQNYYISRRYQCRGRAPNFSIPQFFRAPIARLFNGAYSMNKVMITSHDSDVSCTATQGMEFFEWSLSDGEAVVFDFHHFVGMSESISLSTLISTRASSLLLGKMIYSQATGPGKLILMAKGRAEIISTQQTAGSFPPERLIAMQTNTRFYIDSELDIINTYMSAAYVEPYGGGQVIVDVDSQRGNKTGLGSFLKRFILPL